MESKKTIIISSISLIISLLAFFGFHDIVFQPHLNILIRGGDHGNGTSMLFVEINNTGSAPATNVRLTLNPTSDIIETRTELSADKLELQKRGSRSVTGELPRLSVGSQIVVSTLQNSLIHDTDVTVYVTYDQGEMIKYNTQEKGILYLTK